jgi:hypothetical protein
MHTYRVYGGRLRSDFDLPLLIGTGGGAADWTVRRVGGGTPGGATPPDAMDENAPPVQVDLHRTPRGFRVAISDVGDFDIDAASGEIAWTPGEHDCRDCAQLCLAGDVLPAALHLAGTFTLHGSAVAIDGRGVAFCAPKYHGKSTLARAMLRAGARLASDDCVPLRPGEPVMMQPGIHHVRLWDDSAGHFAADPTGTMSRLGPKHVVQDLPDTHVITDELPLEAIYVLAPVLPDAERTWAARRTLLSPVEAALALVQHGKIGELLSGTDAAEMLRQASAISRAASVYRLEIVRDFARLDDAAARIAGWHAEASRLAGAAVLV